MSVRVSVCMITFNHGDFIADAIDGVLMQRTSFDYELVIGDDCSSDNTSAIIEAYEKKYSPKVKVIRAKSNQGPVANFINTVQKCEGEFIALCEGDDYWVDSQKLEKQVDFLQRNIDYNLVCSAYYLKKGIAKKARVLIKQGSEDKSGFTFYLEDIEKRWITKTLTLVYRRSAASEIFNPSFRYFRDTHLIYILLRNSKGYYFKDLTGVAHVHEGGIHSMTTKKSRAISAFYSYKELYEYYNDEYLRKKIFKTTLSLIRYKVYSLPVLSSDQKKISIIKYSSNIANSLREYFSLLTSIIRNVGKR